ncbi:hypothetical protein HID58_049996 [Brassica napus]|uniref:Secreted protein n=1 Tax=Brassica napus TaxID=3708 RepID=A0ABQ7XFL7_BRANA|nr:hypothetical protein HID58_049996 [Brassica napus]
MLITVVIRGDVCCFFRCACRFFGASGTGPVSDPFVAGYSSAPSVACRVCLGLLLPFFKPENEASVGVAASSTVELMKCMITRGSGWSREINLRLPPQEPCFLIECLSSGSWTHSFSFAKFLVLADLVSLVVYSGASSPIRLLLFAVKVSPGLLRFQPYPRPVFSFQFTVNELLLGLPMANS